MDFRVLIHLQTYPKIFLCILGGVWGGLKFLSKKVSKESLKNLQRNKSIKKMFQAL
jgi:uncharacterized protein YneF (UPF0154 family)